ncbi:MAG: ABC transporter permease [bacterium]|nr:ABC transporter permease [bacterium]
MKKYVIRRLIQLIPILLGITFLTFTLLYLSPGDPAQKKLSAQGVAVTSEMLERTREEMGLNEPFLKQYFSWLGNAMRGDLGISYKDGTLVSTKLTNGLVNTAVLAFAALICAIAISMPLGVYTAVRKNKAADYIIRFFCFAGNAIPNFLLAILLMYFLCIKMRIFPVIAQRSVKGLFLPVAALTIPLISRFIRQIRVVVLQELEKEYVTCARSRGMKGRYILFHHVLHNCMVSIISVFGLAVGTLMGGSVIIETIFMWPGIGKAVMDAITARDYPVIQGFVIISAVIYVGINLLIDLSYHQFNAKIKG